MDGRLVRTPAKAKLTVPTRALAEMIVAEWSAQEERVDPATMPFTRTANSALDKVALQFDDVCSVVSEYAASDLICYRAEGPSELVSRQKQAWDPYLLWAADTFDAPLNTASGLIFVDQPEDSLSKYRQIVSEMTAFELAAFHDLVALSGSFILALATYKLWRSPEETWLASRIDEHWQIEQWGKDEEAEEAETLKRDSFLFSAQFVEACRIRA